GSYPLFNRFIDFLSMNNTENNTYRYIFSDTWYVGQYNYTIWAVNKLGGSNNSYNYSFDISSSAVISVCTIKDEYTGSNTINLTDPPEKPAEIGYEFLDNDLVLHIWNRYDHYYFNTTSGIQLTNHKDDYWSHNVLML
ncbi:MAG: hypothetical protein KKG04_03525, partial [Candidatus Thermoplasmatota archaeon]|nr:hypothetical protein [Candidatus Thermoplasmatota archaeon]